MENGTAVGLLVGGAILILAASPKPQTVNGVPQVAPGGYLNPFNWLSGALRSAPAAGPGFMQTNPGLPPSASPAVPYNARQAAYSPAQSPGGYSPAAYTPQGSPAAPASPMYNNAAYTPPGGTSAPPVASPAAYTTGGAYSPSYGVGGNYRSAAYSPAYSPGGSPTYAA